MSKQPAPIQITATSAPAPTALECKEAMMKAHKKSPVMYHAIIFLIVLIVIFFVLWFMKPALVMKKDASGAVTAEVDFIRVLIAAIIIALLITLAVWLVKAFMGRKHY